MLVELRFEVARFAPRMSQLAFERTQMRFARFRFGSRFEHRDAGFLGGATEHHELVDNFRKSRARILFRKRKLFEACIRGSDQFCDFAESPARIAAVSFGE